MKKTQLLKWNFATSLACLALLLFVGSAPAAVLLYDNFTVLPGGVGNQDVNQGIATGRQTGPLASVSSGFFSTYTFGADHHQVGNTTTDVGQPGGAPNSAYVLLALGGGTFQSDLDIANVSTGPLTIDVDMYNNGANPGGGADTQWVALTLGVPGNTGPNSGGAGEFGFLKRANGGVQVFQNGSDIAGGALDVIGTATADHWKLTFTDTAGTGSAFNGNGSKVTIQNGANVLGTYTLNQLKSSGLRLGFKCDNNRFAGIANLQISGTLAPAPALAVLFHDNFGAYYGLNGDNNLNLNVDLADRQTGPLAPITWTHNSAQCQLGNGSDGSGGTGAGQPFGGPNFEYVLFSNGGCQLDQNPASVSTTTLAVEFDMYVNYDTGNGDWVGFSLRAPGSAFPVAGANEFGFLWRRNGGMQVFQNGSSSFIPGVSTWDTVNFATASHWKLIFTDTAGTGSAFAGNGSKVTFINGTTTLGTITLPQQLPSSGLKLGFNGAGSVCGVDNLTISGTVPAVIAPALVTDIEPLRSEVTTGQSWTLAITAAGSPLNYQWYNQSGPIIGANTNSYTFNAVAGTSTYYCIVTNTAGTIYSSSAVVLSATNLVTVKNFSFENGYTPAYGNGGVPANWTIVNADWAGVANNNYFPNTPLAAPADWNNYLGVNKVSGNADVYQDVGPLQPNTTYYLTVAVGGRNDRINSPVTLQLLNGTDNTGTVLASTVGQPGAQNTFQDSSVTFTTGPTVSGDLTIDLQVVGAGTIQANMDNVRLTTGGLLPANPVLAQDILPASAQTVVGDQVVFSAAFSNSPAANLQWQFITTNGVVSDIAGQTAGTLTLANVQLANTGSYRLKAINQTNSLAVYFSSAASLVVTPVPAPINNVVITAAGQTGWGPGSVGISTNFTPNWTANTNGDLILGSVDTSSLGNPGTVYTPVVNSGNFGLAGGNGDPQIMSDGDSGYLTYDPGTAGNLTLDTCGPYSTVVGANYAGIYVIYTLNTASAANGFDLTNIVVLGGWGDSSQNEQRYQVLYSTVGAPNTFIPMTSWVDYLPTDASGFQSATRTTLTPAAGVLAKNVYAVQISFNSQNPVPKNNYSGYSEIIVAGKVAPARPILTQDISPAAAEDVVGGKLKFAPAFINATSYQWLKNGTNLPGATLPTLTFNSLQLTDAATNGGYSLMAMNTFGTNVSSACTVYVDPALTPTNNVVTAFAYQSSAASGFGPTWDTSLLGASLIAGQNPPLVGADTAANFIGGGDSANGLPVLTDGSYGNFASDGTHPAFAAGGPGAGNYVIYQLGNNSPAANGYNITNIQIAGGWNDFGRDSQFYTILYSTVANPSMFIPLVTVANDLSQGNGEAAVGPPSGVPTTVRGTFTPASGVLASNVYAIQVNFEFPHNVANGYSGYSEISVLGSPSATLPPAGPVITGVHDTNNPTVLLSNPTTPNLIAGQLPSSNGPGVFTEEGCNVTNLTDGILGSGAAYGASCGADGTAVPWIVFTPTNGTWNLTNIVVYTMWNDYGRCGQWYNVSYATTSNPTLFLPLASVGYNPFVPENGTHSANEVQIAPPVGQTLLASNVAAVKFDFTPQGVLNYGWSGYTEIMLQGTNVPAAVVVPPTLPTAFAPPRVSSGNLILTGTGGTPASAPYIWLSTTNLSAPIIWTTNFTGALSSGAFSNSFTIGTNRDRFFRFMMP